MGPKRPSGDVPRLHDASVRPAAYDSKTMTWKTNGYLAAALMALFLLLNIIPTEDDLAMVLATAFIALFLVTVVSLCVAGVRYLRRK